MEPTEYDKEFIEDGGDSDDDDEKSWDDDEDSDDEGGNTEATDGSGDEEEENNAQSEDDNHADTVKRSKKSVSKQYVLTFLLQLSPCYIGPYAPSMKQVLFWFTKLYTFYFRL